MGKLHLLFVILFLHILKFYAVVKLQLQKT